MQGQNGLGVVDLAAHDASRTRLLIVVLLGVLLWGQLGCSTTPASPPAMSPPIPYRVGAPDKLLVSILPEPVIERSVVVRPDGMISVDLIGDVRAAGKTVEEISSDIQQRIGRYKRDAAVTVSVEAAESNSVTIFGMVTTPGTYTLAHETRVAEAIGAHGGATIFAARGKVRVIRFDGRKTTVTRVNLKGIENGDLSTNVKLAGGDIIVVPPHFWARVGFALQSMLFPFQQLFSAGIGAAATAALF